MTIEELLKPRWKVIADFPNSNPFHINDIEIGIPHWCGDGTFYISPHPFDAFCPDSYPAIFKKLEWWEERKEEDMPNFVKFIKFDNRSVMVPGLIFHIYNNPDDPDRHCRFLITEKKGIKFELSKVIPATKEEYEKQHTLS